MIDTGPEGLRHALGALEQHAPAEADVLAGFRDGVVQRRRRRQAASVLVVAGAAVAVTAGVLTVLPDKRGDQPAASALPGATGSAAATSSAPAATPVPAPALPFTVGGLPAGYRLQSWTVGLNQTGDAQYVGTRDFQAIVVAVGAEPREQIAGMTEEPTTVAGRPGKIRRFDPGHNETQIIWQLADGRWAMVGGRAPTVPLAALRAVAESLTQQPTPMSVGWSLTGVPDGYQVVGWTGPSAPPGGSAILCAGPIPITSPQRAGLPGGMPDGCVVMFVRDGIAPATALLFQDKTDPTTPVKATPVDQVQVVNGVTSRATADGTLVNAQLDATHWVQAYSKAAGVDRLREVVSRVSI